VSDAVFIVNDNDIDALSNNDIANYLLLI